MVYPIVIIQDPSSECGPAFGTSHPQVVERTKGYAASPRTYARLSLVRSSSGSSVEKSSRVTQPS
jgi:hypothetical protein